MKRTRITRKRTMGRLLRVEIEPYPAHKNTDLRYRLLFSDGPDKREQIEFSTPVEDGMTILGYLQGLQREHGFPIPQSARPKGPVELRLVETDEP